MRLVVSGSVPWLLCLLAVLYCFPLPTLRIVFCKVVSSGRLHKLAFKADGLLAKLQLLKHCLSLRVSEEPTPYDTYVTQPWYPTRVHACTYACVQSLCFPNKTLGIAMALLRGGMLALP